jgi:peroxiredoxin Q/BCP
MELKTTLQEVFTGIRIFRMKVNDKVPEISLPDENGNTVALKQFRGKPVILFFYPKADTPG